MKIFIAIFLIISLFFIYYSNIINIELFNSQIVQNQKKFILWTGGYDSRFRICEALIDEKEIVQPIYISDIIDNKYEKTNERRHSQVHEFNAMIKIRHELNKLFPYTRHTLLPLINIKKINIDDDIKYQMGILAKQRRVRRKICQYGALAQLSKNMNKKDKKYIEMSVEKEPHSSMLYRTLHNKLNCKGKDCYLRSNLSKKDQSLVIFKYFNFPTINYTKKDMLFIAKKGGYDKILNLTWSCWYPINNKPCGRCIMCRERII
jgi:hypothetical protein